MLRQLISEHPLYTLGYPVSLHADIILRELCRSPLLEAEQLQRCSVESELWISLLMTAF